MKKKGFSVCKEATHCVSCIPVVSGLNMSLISNNRLIFSHNETLNDWNRILCRYFRKCTCFQKGFIILFLELKLNLCPDLSWHWENFIIYRCCSVSISQSLELSLWAIDNFFWNCLNRCALQHVHELTWFNINSDSTLYRDCGSSSDHRGLLFLIFHYLGIVNGLIFTQIASLRSNSSYRWRPWLYTFVSFIKNFLNHFVKFLKFLFRRSARFLWCLSCFHYNFSLSLLSRSGSASGGLRLLYNRILLTRM